MIILFYGQDSYRAKRKLDELMEDHKKKHKSGLNLRYMEAKGTSFADLKNEILMVSMFQEKKLVVLLDIFSNSKLKEDLIEQGDILNNSENILLLFESNDIPVKDRLLVFLNDVAKVEKFEPLKGEKLKDWTRKEVEKLGGKIDQKALVMLTDMVQGNLWQLSNEIMKLVNYSKEEITEKDIKTLVNPNNETNIFDTVDAIAQRNKKKAIGLIKKHIEKGESAILLLATIASQIRNIISVKSSDGERAYDLGMHPFVFSKSLSQSRDFSLEDLKKIYARIVDLDSQIKVGKIDQNIAIDLLITEI
ncbi:MAG: DNA polymerase III subunit delta [Candidatus Pacebacteria bacterium]|nr:DNA polymerase III subunit delta [Candidatus Paceibacterota bacterium]